MQTKSSRGVQQFEVAAAADALLAQGMRPTIERVRQQLGRGSPNTVSPMLESWFAALGQRLGLAPSAAGQVGAPVAVRHALDLVWAGALEAARHEAEASLTQERAALASERAELEQAREAAARLQAVTVQQEATLREAFALAKAQLDQQAQHIDQLQAEVQRSGQKLAGARASLAALVEERDAERRRFDKTLAEQAAQRQRAEERSAATEKRHLEEIDRARQETKQIRTVLQDTQRKLQDEHAQLQQRFAALTDQYNESHSALVLVRERLAAAAVREADLRQQLEVQRALSGTSQTTTSADAKSRPKGKRRTGTATRSAKTGTRP